MGMLYALLESQNYAGISDIVPKTLPKIGYIALLGSQAVAVGFLRKVEGGFAQIDTLASNAYFGSQVRNSGITIVVDELIRSAKQLKLKGILATTSDEGILKRAKSIGFHEVNQSLIAISLTK